jgi:ribose transport system permease protein
MRRAGVPKNENGHGGYKHFQKKIGDFFRGLPVIYLSLMLLFFIVLFFTIGHRSFLSPYNLKTIGNMTAILLTIGLGQLFVLLTGGIDLSVGGIVSLISIVYILSLAQFGFFGIIITLVVALCTGLLNGIIFTRLRIPSFISTLGTGGIFGSIAYLLHAAPLAAPSETYKYLDFINGSIGKINNSWIIALVVYLIYFVIQKYTYLGRTVYAVGSNEKMSWMSGINVKRTKLFAFVLSGMGAGICGIILASNLYSGSAVFGELYVLESIAVVVVGGTALTGGAGGVFNTLVGALIMSIIKNGMTVVGIDIYAQQTFLGILIILAVAVTFDRSKVIIVK